MEIEKFFGTYGLIICNRFLRDSEVNFSLFLDNNEINKSSELFDKDDNDNLVNNKTSFSRRIKKEEMDNFLDLSSYDRSSKLEMFLKGKITATTKEGLKYIDVSYNEEDIDYLISRDSNLFYFSALSRATAILWSDNLIEKYLDKWNWSILKSVKRWGSKWQRRTASTKDASRALKRRLMKNVC